jgi:hypothetical protein
LDLFVDRSFDNSVDILRNIDLNIFDFLYRNILNLFDFDKFLDISRNCDGLLDLLDLRNFDYSLEWDLDSLFDKPVDWNINIEVLIDDSFDKNIDWNIDDFVDNSFNSF